MSEPISQTPDPDAYKTLDTNGDGRLQSSEGVQGFYVNADNSRILAELTPEDRQGQREREAIAGKLTSVNIDAEYAAMGAQFPNGADPLTAENKASIGNGMQFMASDIRGMDSTLMGDMKRVETASKPLLATMGALAADTDSDGRITKQEANTFKDAMQKEGLPTAALPSRREMQAELDAPPTTYQEPEMRSKIDSAPYLSDAMRRAVAQGQEAIAPHGTANSFALSSPHDNAQPQASTARDAAAVAAQKASVEGGIS